ncbi:uncharacterized protein LOC129569575 [Sitodiplosis mosellana]|uniref:uncharacterized protein LOC129569575 n=1 Tax=Sitodiplosis mosellana TaxID=263140 RepID=UPI0024440A6F|nr:uncharacterized protein LOC129569575 [Sitodiplosis mosellana]
MRNLLAAQAAPAVQLAEINNRTCKTCHKLFASRGNRDRHMKRMHNVQLNDAAENDSTDENSENGENRAAVSDTNNQAAKDGTHEMVNEADTSTNNGGSMDSVHEMNNRMEKRTNDGASMIDAHQKQQQQHSRSRSRDRTSLFDLESDSDSDWVPACSRKNASTKACSGSITRSRRAAYTKSTHPMPKPVAIKTEPVESEHSIEPST